MENVKGGKARETKPILKNKIKAYMSSFLKVLSSFGGSGGFGGPKPPLRNPPLPKKGVFYN